MTEGQETSEWVGTVKWKHPRPISDCDARAPDMAILSGIPYICMVWVFDLDAGQPLLHPRGLFICGPRIIKKSLEKGRCGGDGRCSGDVVLNVAVNVVLIPVAKVKCHTTSLWFINHAS